MWYALILSYYKFAEDMGASFQGCIQTNENRTWDSNKQGILSDNAVMMYTFGYFPTLLLNFVLKSVS